MANGNDLIKSRLKEIQESKEKAGVKKPDVVQSIVTGKEEKPDFMKMAEKLNAEKEDKKSENDGYVKDTIYIREDLYNAVQALCVKQGDKKRIVNKMYEDYLTKIYRERMSD